MGQVADVKRESGQFPPPCAEKFFAWDGERGVSGNIPGVNCRYTPCPQFHG